MNHPEPVRLDGPSSVEPDQGGHPLFPRPETETGPDPRKFDIIVVQRWLPDGTKEVCPKPWKGSELKSWQQIIDQYGGECTYQLIAQCGKTHRFQAHSDKAFFGAPRRKPFVEDQRAAAAHASTPPPGYYPYLPTQPPQSGRSDDMVALIRVMMETNASIQTALLKSLLERPAQNDAMIPLLKLLLERPAQNDPMIVVREILPLLRGENPSRTGTGAGYERGIERGIALARQSEGAAPSGGSDELGDLEKVFRLFSLAKSTTAAAPSAPPPQPPPAASPWPAAPNGYGSAVSSPWEGWDCFPTPTGWVMRPSAPPVPPPPPFAWTAPPTAPQPAPVAPATAAPPSAPSPVPPPPAPPAVASPVSVPPEGLAPNLAAKVLHRAPTITAGRSEPAEFATPPIGSTWPAVPAQFRSAADFVAALDQMLSQGEPEPDDNPLRAPATSGSVSAGPRGSFPALPDLVLDSSVGGALAHSRPRKPPS